MRQNTKTNLTMILAAVFIMILVIVTLIPVTDETEVKEIDPGEKWKDMDAAKFRTLSVSEQSEYLKYCKNLREVYNHHTGVVVSLAPEIVEAIEKKLKTNQESETIEAPEPELKTTDNIESEKTEEVQEQKKNSDLDEKRKALSIVEITYKDVFFDVDEWEAEILKERVEADEPTSLAILAERFGITEAEVSKIESELIAELESLVKEPETQKTPSVLDQKPALNLTDVMPKKEQKTDPEPEKTANEQAPEQAAEQANEQAPEQEQQATVQADEQPKQATEPASGQDKQADSQKVEQKSSKKELGDLEKECVLCGTIIPKYPHNVKICSDCKAEAVKANMLQRDYIARELAKKGGNDEE